MTSALIIVAIVLAAIVAPIMSSVGAWETAFPARYFRPLTERSTDTGFAILKRLEIPSGRKIKERV